MQILVPQPRVEPLPPAVEAWSPNHWTAREVPSVPLYIIILITRGGDFVTLILKTSQFSLREIEPLPSIIECEVWYARLQTAPCSSL